MVVISANGDRYENAIILPKNTPIPAVDSQIKVLSTSPGDENELEIYLLQGESIRPQTITYLASTHSREFLIILEKHALKLDISMMRMES